MRKTIETIALILGILGGVIGICAGLSEYVVSMGILVAVLSILGAIGAVEVKSRPKLACVLMLLAALFVYSFSILASILFIIGGFLALILALLGKKLIEKS